MSFLLVGHYFNILFSMNKKVKRTTSSRKRDHVLLTVNKNVTFREKTNGLEKWEFVHNALPEINLSDVDTRTKFLGKELSLPLMVSCMTGGYKEAEKINRELAEVCEEFHLAMGVGSQRQAMEDTTYHSSFSVARKSAPSIPLIGNIGAPEVAKLNDVSPILRLAEMINADAFAVHLNPLQEFLQPEGNTNFRGVLSGIERLVKHLPIPIIVKEIGAGISGEVALRLINAGVTYIDVAGAGGTSWAGVEILRRDESKNEREQWNPFWDWGIPTADAVREVAGMKQQFPSLKVIASGGISRAIDGAKSVALGADMVASARPMLKALMHGEKKELRSMITQWQTEFRGIMFLLGAKSVQDLMTTKRIKRI
ncbi:MAG: type 2 isopentenyl-diphosphate Delta-isomerase [Ignavibacteriales bacterium]|nr:type 2 isopentenyl-diphosphate Delta-isomerase [Ignavibacteriales bacterium]